MGDDPSPRLPQRKVGLFSPCWFSVPERLSNLHVPLHGSAVYLHRRLLYYVDNRGGKEPEKSERQVNLIGKRLGATGRRKKKTKGRKGEGPKSLYGQERRNP
jgi:hypothetical protein